MTAIKQKVKYTVAYDSSNDTLSEKLNVLLGNIVTLIRTNNDDLLELTRITYGSEQMTGAPLYENTTQIHNGRKFQSDVVFLGTDKNNLVLSICFYDGCLVIAMNADPTVEALYASIWDNVKPYNTTVPNFATPKACQYIKSNGFNSYNIHLPYIIANNSIEIGVVYWTGNFSSGYMFYNSNRATNGVDLIIFKTIEDDENTEGIGGALYRYTTAPNTYNNFNPSQLLVWSFAENLANNMITEHKLNNTDGSNTTDANMTVYHNSKHDLRQWFQTTGTVHSNEHFRRNSMADLHTLGNFDGALITNNALNSTAMPNYDTVETSGTDTWHISALCSAYNLPYIEGDTQAYFRKIHVPGFNKHCKGEIYLMWTPSLTSYKSGDIVSCDGKKFAVINQGVVCWVARVE